MGEKKETVLDIARELMRVEPGRWETPESRVWLKYKDLQWLGKRIMAAVRREKRTEKKKGQKHEQ